MGNENQEIEQNYEPSAEEIKNLTNPPVEPMMEMEPSQTTPDDQHAVNFDENGKIKFTANGGEVEATREEVIKYAQQGYGAANKIGQLNQQIEELKSKEVPEEFSQYKELDEWAKQNPDQWNAIKSQYEQSTQQNTTQESQLPPEIQQAIAPLMEEIQGLREFKQSYEAEKQEQKIRAEDTALDQEIKSIREEYTDLDFDAPDDEGHSLEWKVMKHAADKGITSFKTAFLDFNHEKLVKLAEERGKQSVIEERQKRNKLGLLDIQASSPKEVVNPDYNPVTASDLENFEAALADLKQG